MAIISPCRTIVWLSPDQADLARAVASTANLVLVAAGSPVRGQSEAVATALSASALHDLRGALVAGDADLIWMLSPGPFGVGANGDDAAALLSAQARGVRVATLEPIPAGALDLVGGWWTAPPAGVAPVDAARFGPLPRHSRVFRDAQDILSAFGRVRTLAVECWSTPAEGSLGAGVFGAMELVRAVMGDAETIEASLAQAAAPGLAAARAGETLRDLHGDLAANLRFADSRCASLVVSDQAGRWEQRATLLGDQGRLCITHQSLEWLGPDGRVVDEIRPKRRSKPGAALPPAVVAIADSLTRLMDRTIPEPQPTDHAAVLSMAQAALLSARTGQGEAPAAISRMVGAA